MAKILVTGGAGFIGSHLVDALLDQKHTVVVLDDLSTGKRSYVDPRAKFYKTSIVNAVKVIEIFKQEKVDFVYHLAAQMDVRVSVEKPELDNKINIIGGFNILSACKQFGVEKIVFVSTGGAVYGDTKEIPTTEKVVPYPLSPYGIHKLAFEKYLRFYYEVYGQNYTVLRFANIYGPRQYKGGEAGVVSIFVDHAVRSKELIINGTGKQTRDYVYVGDVVAALLKARDVKYQGEINIGLGREVNLLQIVKAIKLALPSQKLVVSHAPAKVGEQQRSCLDNSLAKNVLKWQPKVQLEDGIQKTIDWAKTQVK